MPALAPDRPLTLEEALYALIYHCARLEAEEDPILRSLNIEQYSVTRMFMKVRDAKLVYTERFDPDLSVCSPAWQFTMEYSTGANPPTLRVWVDAATGDMFDEFQLHHWPSPYTSRDATAAGAEAFALMAVQEAEYTAMYPISLGQQDGYTYYMVPPDYGHIDPNAAVVLSKGARIMRCNDATGEETLPDDRASYWVPGHDVNTMRNSIRRLPLV